MDMDKMFKEMLAGKEKDRKAIKMIRGTKYEFLCKQLNDVGEKFSVLLDELEAQHKKDSTKVWHEILSGLREENLISDKEEDIEFEDGVIFLNKDIEE